MPSSLADKGEPVEFFTKSSWVDFYCHGDEIDCVVDLHTARNPFERSDLTAVWGFDREHYDLVMFHNPQSIMQNDSVPSKDSLEALFFISWAPVIVDFLKNGTLTDHIAEVALSNNMLKSENFTKEVNTFTKEKKHFGIISKSFSKYYLFGLYDTRRFIDKTRGRDKIVPQQVVNFHDHYILNSGLWGALPRRYVLDNFNDKVLGYYALYCETKQYDPFKNNGNSFIWPWQQCMIGSKSDGKTPTIDYKSIPTTSLVFDVRNSSAAMDLTDKPERFAEFIDEITAVSKRILIEEGGIFDKETGDGISGHFYEFTDPRMNDNMKAPVLRAFMAARRICWCVKVICAKYQDELKIGIDGLGASVGIHTEEAVWITSDTQIRAIGPSVVKASRHCSAAKEHCIVVSNKAYLALFPDLTHDDIANFHKCPIDIKELHTRAKPYGYSYEC